MEWLVKKRKDYPFRVMLPLKGSPDPSKLPVEEYGNIAVAAITKDKVRVYLFKTQQGADKFSAKYANS